MKHLFPVNILLAIIAIIVLATAIILETSHGMPTFGLSIYFWLWVHIACSVLMGVLVFIHLRLNWNRVSSWIERFRKSHSKVNKALFILSFLTFSSGLVATITIFTIGHGPVGSIHGKIGFVFLLICIGHFIKRIKWYKRSLASSKK